jgi:4-amino-4-deoxy-L-arabinose transferase-like glycosyltransferase
LLALGLILAASVALSACLLTRDHGWGDDFAAYIMQAQSILKGDMQGFVQHNTFTISESAYNIGPVTQLWGFPLLLAPAVAAFGIDILRLKLVLTLLHAVFLCAFFLLARTRLDPGKSLLVTALVAFNPLWLQAQNDVLSDLPFAAFSTLALWLISRGESRETRSGRNIGAGLLVGAALFAAAFTRWTGWLLLVPLAATQLRSLRLKSRADVRWSMWIVQAAIPYLTFVALYGLQTRLFPNLPYPLRDQFAELTLATLWANLGFYLSLSASFFDHAFGGGMLIQVVLMALYLLSAVQRRGRDAPIHLYVLATLVTLVAFPAHGGPRFLYAIWPLLVLFAFDGLTWGAERLRSAHQLAAVPAAYSFWFALIIVSVSACVQAGRANLSAGRIPPRAAWGAFSPTSEQMYAFVRSQTAADSVIIFFKPRAMRLMTGRDSIMMLRCSRLRRGDYVIIERTRGGVEQISPREIASCGPALDPNPVFENEEFTAYRVLHRN